MTACPSFFLSLNPTALGECAAFYLSICPSGSTGAATILHLLWIKLLRAEMHKYLFEFLLSIHRDKYPKADLLEPMAILHLIFWGTAISFCTEAVPFYISASSARGSQLLHILKTFIFWIIVNTKCTISRAPPLFRPKSPPGTVLFVLNASLEPASGHTGRCEFSHLFILEAHFTIEFCVDILF